jgi:hypothetical protein
MDCISAVQALIPAAASPGRPDAMPRIRLYAIGSAAAGKGIDLRRMVGLVLGELLLDGQAQAVDIPPFRPGRFAEGKPINAECEYVDD